MPKKPKYSAEEKFEILQETKASHIPLKFIFQKHGIGESNLIAGKRITKDMVCQD